KHVIPRKNRVDVRVEAVPLLLRAGTTHPDTRHGKGRSGVSGVGVRVTASTLRQVLKHNTERVTPRKRGTGHAVVVTVNQRRWGRYVTVVPPENVHMLDPQVTRERSPREPFGDVHTFGDENPELTATQFVRVCGIL